MSEQETLPQEGQPSEIEQKAMDMGWKPRDQFDEDSGKEFIEADEYVRRQPFFDKIEALNRKVKTMEQGLEAFKEHHSKVKQVEYERALADLKKERLQAIEEQDAVKAFEVSDKMRELEKQKEQAATPQEGVANPQFQEWLDENKWYVKDEDLREFADALGIMYAKKMSPPEVLVKVSDEVRKKFPEKFRNPNKDRAPAVDTKGTARGTATGREYQLTDMEKQIMDKLIRSGAMTKEEYIKELKRAKGE